MEMPTFLILLFTFFNCKFGSGSRQTVAKPTADPDAPHKN